MNLSLTVFRKLIYCSEFSSFGKKEQKKSVFAMLTTYLVNSPHNIYAHNSLEKISSLLQAERSNYCSGPNLSYHKTQS